MKKMNAINIDKWRVLNKPLFEAYVSTYKALQDDSNKIAPETLISKFKERGILEALTKEGYGTAYTIAREIGIYYEENGKYILSNMAKLFANGKLTYQDYLKYYCLNVEFLINDEVTHPFLEIIEALKDSKLDKNEIAKKCTKLVPTGSPENVIDCLRLFLNRCVEAELLQCEKGYYSLKYSYNLLLGSINKSNYNTNEFDKLFITGDSKITQKNLVTILLERKIPQLFEKSIELIGHNESLVKSTIEHSEHEYKEFNFIEFLDLLYKCNLKINSQLIIRFISSLFSKPFLICSGLSGSGKTKLAQAFVQWICKAESQYKIVPVGADWTNREPLLGYPNGLDDKTYAMPDSGVLNLILDAAKNSNVPYFLILDEMNLSHVERYFADFLSIMESKDSIMLYDGQDRIAKINDTEITIPKKIFWPENLFIIGTVNIDETTYMFSPKVLDRANVIEFRIGPEEMTEFLKTNGNVNMDNLFIDGKKGNGGLGQSMATSFLETSKDKEIDQTIDIAVLSDFFRELQNVGAEFGYRTATEIKKLVKHLNQLNFEGEVIDVAIIQKLLPKLHGSRKKIITPLETLAGFCLDHGSISVNKYNEYCKNSTGFDIKYPLSFAKIERMIKNAIENGYTSYAEA